MIEDTFIVQDTRRVRCAISERFANDVDLYIDYLQSKSAPSVQATPCEAIDNRESIKTSTQKPERVNQTCPPKNVQESS